MNSNTKLTKLIDVLVESNRGALIFCIKELGGTFSENELWSLSVEPESALRERIKNLILAEIEKLKSYSN